MIIRSHPLNETGQGGRVLGASRVALAKAVLPQEAGRWRESNPAPQCCCTRAANSDLPAPVGPARWTAKSVPPVAARQITANNGTVIRSGARSSILRLARIAVFRSL